MKKKLVFIVIIVIVFLFIGCISIGAVSNPSNATFLYTPSEDNSKKVVEILYDKASIDNIIRYEDNSGIEGPKSFYVYNKNIFIGNTLDNNILVYKDGKLHNIIMYDSKYLLYDLCVSNDKIYILDKWHRSNTTEVINRLVCIDMNGDTVFEVTIPNLSPLEINGEKWYNLVENIQFNDDKLIITYASSDQKYWYSNGEWIPLNDGTFQVDYKNKNVKIYQDEIESATTHDSKYTNVRLIKESEHKAVFLSNETYTNEKAKITVKEKTINYMVDGVITKKVKLIDNDKLINQNRTYFIDETDDIYQMIIDQELNLSIYKINASIDYYSSVEIVKEKKAKILFVVSDFIHSSLGFFETTNKVKADNVISRDSIYVTAELFENHSWEYNCIDNGNKNVVIGCNKYGCDEDCTAVDPVKPAWLPATGTNLCTGTCSDHPVVGIPYCWGGQSYNYLPEGSSLTTHQQYLQFGTDAFDLQIEDEKWYAGNTRNNGHEYLHNTAGLDCSGFTYLCFGYPSRDGTTKLAGYESDQVTRLSASVDDFYDIPLVDGKYISALNGDILVKFGHVMIVNEKIWNSNYTDIVDINVYESTTQNSVDKVKQQNQNIATYINNFSIRRHDNIEECGCTGSVSSTWTNWRTDINSGYECLVRICSECDAKYDYSIGDICVYDDENDNTCNNCGHIRNTCSHSYSYNCSEECNLCDYIRDDAPNSHSYSNSCDAVCDVCNEVSRENDELVHIYTDACDEICNNCLQTTREAPHIYSDDCDADCNNINCTADDRIPEHTYSNVCDAECDNVNCTADDRIPPHNFAYTCSEVCSETNCSAQAISPAPHTYEYICSTNCTVCNEGNREASHSYSLACDTECVYNCGNGNRVVTHVYTNSCDSVCNICISTTRLVNHVYSGYCDDTCNACSYVRTIYHYYDDCEDETCANCSYQRTAPGHLREGCDDITCDNCLYTFYPRSHSYINCDELDCMYSDCSYQRSSAPGHIYEDHESEECSVCFEPRTVDITYAWVPKSEEQVCCEFVGTCNNCYESWVVISDTTHSYTNCVDATCNDCEYIRPSVPGHNYQFDHAIDVSSESICHENHLLCTICNDENVENDTSHNWAYQCDTSCDDCTYVRIVSHSYSGSWDKISTQYQCREYIMTCTLSGCGYSYVDDVDDTHRYTNSCDSSCNDCDYNRTISHSYTSAWINVSTSSTCQRLVYTCSVCGYWYTASYDYTHSYTNSCDTSCNDCGYPRSISHSYTGSWENVSTASVCKEYIKTCTVCGYWYVYSQDTSHLWSNSCDTSCNDCNYYRSITHTYTNACDTTCNVCGATRSITHSWNSGTWVEVSTQYTCRKWVKTCTVCSATTTTSYDYTHNYLYGDPMYGCMDCGYTEY